LYTEANFDLNTHRSIERGINRKKKRNLKVEFLEGQRRWKGERKKKEGI
jgi:hypothetical protein